MFSGSAIKTTESPFSSSKLKLTETELEAGREMVVFDSCLRFPLERWRADTTTLLTRSEPEFESVVLRMLEPEKEALEMLMSKKRDSGPSVLKGSKSTQPFAPLSSQSKMTALMSAVMAEPHQLSSAEIADVKSFLKANCELL